MNCIASRKLELAHAALSWEEGVPLSGAPGAEAPVIVFLHGLAGGGFCWRAQLQAWSGRARCLAPDLPGYGASTLPPSDSASLAALSASIIAWLDALGIARCRLAGSSWGGSIALWLAAASPARIERLLLVSPLHPDFSPDRRQRLLLHPPLARLAARLLQLGPRRLRRWALEEMYGDPRRLSAAVFAAYAGALAGPGFPRAAAAYVAPWRRDQAALRLLLPGLRLPIMLLWGDRDRVLPPAGAAPLLARLPPGAAFRPLPGLGHLPYQECPAAFAAAAAPFLLQSCSSNGI